MPRKRKKLVEDFEELLEAGDMDALKAVYDTCALDADTTRTRHSHFGTPRQSSCAG